MVYVDDCIGLAITTSKQILDHVVNGVLHYIHNIFPSNPNETEDAIALRKFLIGDGEWNTLQELLGFVLDRVHHTMWPTKG